MDESVFLQKNILFVSLFFEGFTFFKVVIYMFCRSTKICHIGPSIYRGVKK